VPGKVTGGCLVFARTSAWALVLLCLFFCSISAAKDKPCPRKAVSEANRARRLSYADTLARAVHQVQPDLPGGLGRIHGTIVVAIIIDETGKVLCAINRSKHDRVLGEFCVDAAKQWTFRPVVVEGRQVKVWGQLDFYLDR
jgi:hypothetical protein